MTAHPKPTRRRPKQPAHVPAKVLAKLTERDGHRSAWTGLDVDTLVPQHRQGGMGGRRGKHSLANLVWLESDLNGAIKDNADLQAEAMRRGIAISIHADPRLVPVEHAVHGEVWLTEDGRAVPTGQEVQL